MECIGICVIGLTRLFERYNFGHIPSPKQLSLLERSHEKERKYDVVTRAKIFAKLALEDRFHPAL